MTNRRKLHVGDNVKLTPKGPLGRVLRFPRKQTGEPPLATVEWENGKTNLHDQRDLIFIPKDQERGS
jgi:hypothetical protein